MKPWLILVLFASVAALAVGCGGNGNSGSNNGDGGVSGAAGCQGLCQNTIECLNQLFDGGTFGLDGGFAISVNQCVQACQSTVAGESAACRSAVDSLGSCLSAQSSCSGAAACDTQASTVSSSCSTPPVAY